MLTHYGLVIGIGLVLMATCTAFALIARAAKGVAEFRHEDHEMLKGKEVR